MFGRDFNAVVAIVCTDRGRHGERLIEAMKQDGRRWFGAAIVLLV